MRFWEVLLLDCARRLCTTVQGVCTPVQCIFAHSDTSTITRITESDGKVTAKDIPVTLYVVVIQCIAVKSDGDGSF